MKFQAIIRADASLRMGTGHVMRCLTLAEELQGRGLQSVFICRDRKGNLISLVRERGFEVLVLPFKDREEEGYVLGGSIEEEFEAVSSLSGRAVKAGGEKPVLVVDHYAIGSEWEGRMRAPVSSILVIDDLEDRPHECDILLDQNYSLKEDRYSDLVPPACRRLLGPAYALLRREFIEARRKIDRSGLSEFNPKSVLLFFGGSDPDNHTGRLLQILKDMGGFEPEVVVGASHPALRQIEGLVGSMPGARLHVQTSEMAKIMTRCSWYLGAGGSVTWERMALGLTGIVIPVAENQRATAELLDSVNLSVSLDLRLNADAGEIRDAIERFLSSPERIKEMRRRCMELVDGTGASRVAESFCGASQKIWTN